MKIEGFTNNQIKKITGLTVDEIEKMWPNIVQNQREYTGQKL